MTEAKRGASAFDLDITHHALSVARIVFFGAVFAELAGLYSWRRLSYLSAHWWVADVLLPLHLVVVAAIVFGFRTRAALLLNYPLAWIVLGAARDQYHFDCMIENLSFVFLFAPRPARLAVDAIGAAAAGPVPRSFTILLFTALALTYADSVSFKLESASWTSGFAFWLGAANPPFSTGALPDVLEMTWLMRACTYVALAYEALFPLVLVRALRPAVVATGIVLHLGIAIFYPLPWFGLGVAGLVAAFLPLGRSSGAGAPVATAWRRVTAAAAYAACAALVTAQLALAIGFPRGTLAEITGVYRHPIFFDWHFLVRSPLLAFRAVREGREVFIPSFDAQGRSEVRNRYWTLLAFRARGRGGRAPMHRYLAGWFTRQGWPEGPVRLYAKEVALDSLDLDFDQDERIERAPWRLLGEIVITPYHLQTHEGEARAPLRLRGK